MTASPISCDPGRLERLLENELPSADEAEATRHVAECATCRTRLEQLAADRSWWREAATQLRGGEWKEDGTLWLTSRDFAASDATADHTGGEAVNQPENDAWLQSLDFLDACDDPAMLGRIGSYDVLEMIGSGGFGVVLKGYDRELNRYVAIKVLAPHLAHSAAARKRFAREAQAAAAIVHPHVVPIHAVDAGRSLPYLVMPFIAGESLQQRIDRVGPLDLKEILRIGLQTAHGLAAAHAQGLVHRDIKPANILLEHGVDRVMLTDFGLARAMDDASLTRSTVIAGTPQYMSPEQARGEAIDFRTDLFSLGSVMYAMCVGHPPFRAETMLGVLRRVSDEAPRPVRELNADVPAWLEMVLERLLAKTASRRFQSAAELAELLEQCLAHVQQPTVSRLPDSLFHRCDRSPARSRRIAMGTGLAVALIVLGAYGAAFLAGMLPFGSAAVDEQPPSIARKAAAPNLVEAGPADDTRSVPAALIDASSSPRGSPVATGPAPPWHDASDWRELAGIAAELERLEQWAPVRNFRRPGGAGR
jgi:serine/threonine-protein kinase